MAGLLSGIRVTDFTWALAGPLVSEILALMGSEVIKIENPNYPDILRTFSSSMGMSDEKDLEKSVEFNFANLNKLSISLDLSKPKGIEIAKRLISESDVVMENFSPGVMEKLGLSYKEVKKIKPDIIMLSISYSGQTGPESRYLGYASLFYAASGLSYLTGYPDSPPGYVKLATDPNVGATATVAMLAALCHRQHTGEGQHIDVSARESISCLIGPSFIDACLGRSPVRQGNLDDKMAPHNCYPCKGEENWISIAVEHDHEWQRVCSVLGEHSLADDSRFATSEARLKNRGELDQAVSALTARFDASKLTHMLQEEGVAAFPALRAPDIFSDPHLNFREFFTEVEHAKIGKQNVFAPPWKFTDLSPKIISPGPLMGEHNSYVLKELLGMTDKQIAELKKEGALC